LHLVTSLSLRNTDIGAEAFAPITRLQHLRSLTLYNCPNIRADMLCSMDSAARLLSLELDGCAHV
jgi:hypothetical protein